VDFNSPNRIEPFVDFIARTEVAGENITLQIDGGGSSDLTTTLSSSTGLSEPNIVSLLLTGRTLDRVRLEGMNVAQEQALSYVTGSIGSVFSRGAERALGLSRVRIEPNLIASESDPGARLTIGQDITRALELIYSMNLRDSGDQIWIAEYEFGRRLATRGIRQEDNSYRLELRHDLRFGGAPAVPVQGQSASGVRGRVVREITISPQEFAGRTLSREFDVDPGSRYDPFGIRRGTDRLEEFFAGMDYLEARIRIRREEVGEEIRLLLDIEPGLPVQFDFAGATVERGAVRRVQDAWQGGGFDGLRTRRATAALRAAFVDDGYLGVGIESSVSSADGAKRVRFDVRPGPRYRQVEVDFPGARGMSADSHRSAIRDAGLWEEIHGEQERVRTLLEQRYQANGYLDARVEEPRYELDAARFRARLLFALVEGPLYAVAEVSLEGNDRVPAETLTDGMPAPRVMTVEWMDLAERHIEERYWELGYNDVLIGRSQVRRPADGSVEVVFRIQENERSVVQEIEVAGNRTTSPGLARGQIDFAPGEPLSYERLNASRRAIYDTGA
jgi:hypothetical protein